MTISILYSLADGEYHLVREMGVDEETTVARLSQAEIQSACETGTIEVSTAWGDDLDKYGITLEEWESYPFVGYDSNGDVIHAVRVST